MADIVLINPKFDRDLLGPRTRAAAVREARQSAGRCLAAAGGADAGRAHVTIIDENVEPIDFERCARADIVGVTGMSVQRVRMREILTELKRRGRFHRGRRPVGHRRRRTTSAISPMSSLSARRRRLGRSFWPNGSRAGTSAATSRPRRPT